MQAYLARRLIALIPALFFASLIVFVIVRLVPGSIIDMMLVAERCRRRQALARPADPDARSRPADVGAVLQLDRRHPLAWRFRPLAVAEHAGLANCCERGCRSRFELGLMALIVALLIGHSDRNLFGDPAGHRRRLPHPFVLDPDVGGAELLDGHHGDGISVDLVGLVAASEVCRVHRRPVAKPASDDPAGASSSAPRFRPSRCA